MARWICFLFLLNCTVSLADSCPERLGAESTFEDLQTKVLQCGIGSLEKLLPLLSIQHLSQYVLVHHSQSLQGASAESPRVILYGKAAKLVLAFNGDPSQERYRNLEIIQYRDSSRRFEFRDIEFNEGSASPTISPPNPPICMSCHRGADPRPNWAGYPLWPGAFGGEDDGIFRLTAPMDRSSEDWVTYQFFLDHQKQHGRYQFLSEKPAAELPNTVLGSLLQELNLHRIARKLSTEKLIRFRYAILGAVSCFYSDHHTFIQDFVPASTQTGFKLTYDQVLNHTVDQNRVAFLDRIQDLQAIDAHAPLSSRVQEIWEIERDPTSAILVSDQIMARLRWITENLGERVDDWSLQFGPPSADLENGYVGVSDLQRILPDELLPAEADSALRSVLDHRVDGDLEIICDQLQQKSQGVLTFSANSSNLPVRQTHY